MEEKIGIGASKAAPGSEAVEYFFQEQTQRRSYLDPNSLYAPYNPDDLVQKYQDFSIYEDMLKDDAVSACSTLKKEMVLCNGFDFISSDESHQEIVEDLKIALCEDPEWSFDEMLEEMLSAYDFGLSITEKVFKTRPDGKLSLRFLKTRHPAPWLLHEDDFGNVIKYEQRGTPNTEVNPKSLIHFINRRRFGNPYGTSDLRAAHQAWFTKKHISRWYAVFIEKSGSPIPVGKYDSGKASTEAKTDLYNSLKRFQTKSALVIPKEFEVDFLESSNTGEAFKNAINIFNMFIGRSMLIPDLMGLSGSEISGGSYALGEQQMEIFFKHIRRRRIILERVINNELVWPIVLYNYGYVDHYPKFTFRPITEKQTIEYVKLWLDAVKSRVYAPSEGEVSHFREIINFPSSQDGAETIPEESEELESGEEKETENGDEKAVEVIATSDGDQTVFAAERKYGNPGGTFWQRTDFSLIEQTLDSSLAHMMAVSKPIINEVFDSLKAKVEKYNGKPEAIDKVKIADSTKFAAMLKRELKAIYRKGFDLAQSELFTQKYAKPLVDDAFLDVLNGEVDQFAIDWSDAINKKMRPIMVASVKDGLSVKETVAALIDQIPAVSQASMERFARTKFTEVMNKGRLSFFEKSGVIAAYQYSAILDDRTTTICRGLHGKIFEAGTQPVPPMHFNCRSVLIPVTKYDTFEVSDKVGKTPIDDFIDEHKGAGFPRG